MDIAELLAFTQQNKASDLHLVSGREPMLRLDGELRPIKTGDLAGEQVRAMIHAVMTEEQRAEYEREHEIDFAISFGHDARFRVNAFTTTTGPAAVFRTIPTVIPSLEQLRAPPMFADLVELERGMVLVTGPTGSGKSTTLAAMIDHINEHSARHVLTIEDPVEFVHHPKNALINHREVGRHTRSFARALKSALREDPDVILVGEMRDQETIGLALTAAETGHLVLGTLHTSSAAKTVDRIIDVFPAGDKDMVRTMLAGSLQAVIAQVLLPRIGGGRVAAHEVLIGTPAVRNLIRENKIPQIYSMMQMGSRFGMQTLQEALETLVRQNVVTQEDAARFMTQHTDDEAKAPANVGAARPPAAAPAPVQAAARTQAAPAARGTQPAPAAAEPEKKRGLRSLF